MKLVHTTVALFATLCPAAMLAQAPEAFTYQAVARDVGGEALANTVIGVQFQLHQFTANGPVVFSETHGPTTDQLGLFSLEVGNGLPGIGSLSAIDWKAGPYFLEVGLDPAGSSNYTSLGIQQLLSVPYALHAGDDGDWVVNGDTLHSQGRSLAVGTTAPHPSAIAEISSTAQGFLPPRMTQAQRDAIPDPAIGLMIYCTDCGANGEMQFAGGTGWQNMIGGLAKGQFSVQLGNDLDGETSGDVSGRAVALSSDGSRLAVGEKGSDANGANSGQVRIYQFNSAGWVQLGGAIVGEASGDEFGESVALSANGHRVAIGARLNDGNGSEAGHVRIYDWNGASWVQVGSDIDGELAFDRSGQSVALSAAGDRVAIGAAGNDGNGSSSGHVRCFDWNGSNWVQVGSDIDGEAASDLSGAAVALSASGDRVAIGARQNDGSGFDAGHVRVYDWNGTNWVQVGADIDGESPTENSGVSVALSASGNRVAIGAYTNAGQAPYTGGQVRIYDWNGSSWVQAGADIEGTVADGYLGTSVDLSDDGDRVAIGAPHLLLGAPGYTQVFQWQNTAWIQVGADIIGEAPDDLSGIAIALSGNGGRLAIGASNNNGNGSASGHVRVFE